MNSISNEPVEYGVIFPIKKNAEVILKYDRVNDFVYIISAYRGLRINPIWIIKNFLPECEKCLWHLQCVKNIVEEIIEIKYCDRIEHRLRKRGEN
jgi:hypothetical protein